MRSYESYHVDVSSGFLYQAYINAAMIAPRYNTLPHIHCRTAAYSQTAYGKLCAQLFNYVIWWVRVMVEGWGFG